MKGLVKCIEESLLDMDDNFISKEDLYLTAIIEQLKTYISTLYAYKISCTHNTININFKSVEINMDKLVTDFKQFLIDSGITYKFEEEESKSSNLLLYDWMFDILYGNFKPDQFCIDFTRIYDSKDKTTRFQMSIYVSGINNRNSFMKLKKELLK